MTILCAKIWAIAKQSSRWIALIPLFLPFTFTLSHPQSKPILVQPEIQYQRMDGFGATGGNGSAKEISSLPEPERTKLLDLLFGPDGARINIIRNEVGWTGERLPFAHPMYLRGLLYLFSEDDHETTQFSLTSEAQKRNEMIVNSCVWSPPPHWKTNNSYKEGGELLPKHYQDFADYLFGYLHFYKKMRNEDIHILSLQNEPNKELPSQSCLWSAEQLKDFVKIVGKRFKQQGVPTKIMLPEVEWQQAPTYLQPILEDAEARQYISYISAHSYNSSTAKVAMVKEICKKHNLKLWQSEFAVNQEGKSQDMADGLQLAEQMLQDLTQSDCHAWLYWAFLTPSGWTGRQGLLVREGNSFKSSKRFWCFSQFSRFIPRDSVRVSAGGGTLPVIAFRNPQYNGITVVLINPTSQATAETIELRGWTMERMVAYRTSENEDCLQIPLPAESGSKRSVILEPRSVTTLIAQIRRVRGE